MKHNELKKGMIIVYKDSPHEVLKASHTVRGRGKSVMQTQLKNLCTGNNIKNTFHPSEEIEEAEVEKEDVVFIYGHRGKYVFHKKSDPSARYEFSEDVLGEKIYYLKEKLVVSIVFYKEEVIGINLPVKISFKVVEAPPGVKGNRAEGGSKVVTLETGKKINAPLFIEEGDLVEVNTESEEYIRRV